MYSISKQDCGRFRIVNPNHFKPSTPNSGEDLLHFSYKLADLQAEIEKRTFYLGKYRKTEEAQHILDVVGMSRDEGDLLYSFAKAAMADVYDNFNKFSLHIPKNYEWIDDTKQILIVKLPNIDTATGTTKNANSNITASISSDKRSFIVSGDITGVTNATNPCPDAKLYNLEVSGIINYHSTCKLNDTDGTTTSAQKAVSFSIPLSSIHGVQTTSGSTTTNKWIVSPYEVFANLDPQTPAASAEEISTFDSIVLSSIYVVENEPVLLPAGSVVDYRTSSTATTGTIYEVLQDTDSSHFDITDTTQVVLRDSNDIFPEGIHYFLAIPQYINITSVEPLDNAILEALVNRIIWKWLILSFPDEAKNYDALYQGAIESLRTRCNIFNKNWQRTPRIF